MANACTRDALMNIVSIAFLFRMKVISLVSEASGVDRWLPRKTSVNKSFKKARVLGLVEAKSNGCEIRFLVSFNHNGVSMIPP